MVILGLGSNLNDRMANLRQALALIKKIPDLTVMQVSPVYISDALLPDNAPDTWDVPYLNCALRCDTTLAPYELLKHTKEIEIAVGRKPEKNWGPRIVDIDILAWDDFVQYDEALHIPHENLHERPFALWPLADVAPRWIYPLQGALCGKTADEITSHWGSRLEGNAPFRTRQIFQRIDKPALVGILNVTPDSFSDGGQFFNLESALAHVRNLMAAGAEIIDVGAEATGPKASLIDEQTEWERLEPVLQVLTAEVPGMLIPPKISVDTRHVSVAQRSLNLSVNWLNDVSGLSQPAMQDLLAQNECDVVVMHNLGVPAVHRHLLPATANPVEAIYAWGEKKLLALKKAGVALERVIFDVGIGYGNSAAQALELIKHITAFKALNVRLLIGHSRKSFLQQFTLLPASERDIETVALSLFLAKQEVDYLRVHNVEAHARAFRVDGALV